MFFMIIGFANVGDGLGLASRVSAQTRKAGTFNIHIAGPFGFGGWGIDDWIETRRWLVKDAVVAAQPDIMGFQEAFTRNNGVTQQASLGEVFENTPWRLYTWEIANEYNQTPKEDNVNPIIVNTDRLAHVAAGSRTVNFENVLGAADWEDYHHLHEIFHGDQAEDGSWSAHSLKPERYVNWVVSDDHEFGGRVAYLTSHYETFIGGIGEFDPDAVHDEDGYRDTYGNLFDRFSNLVNSSFGYASQEIHAEAELLRNQYGDLSVIIGEDFETSDPSLPSQQEFEDAGYVETFRFIKGDDRRATMGIDNLFAMTDDFWINSSDYDWNDYTNPDGTIRASDHRPLYAEFTVLSVPEPSGLYIVTLGFLGAALFTRRRYRLATTTIL